MKANQRTAARIKAAVYRLMEMIPPEDRAKIETSLEVIHLVDEPPAEGDQFTAGGVSHRDNGKTVMYFYLTEMKYMRRDFFAIVAHEFGHVIAGYLESEVENERAAQDVVRRWGIETALRIVVTGQDDSGNIHAVSV